MPPGAEPPEEELPPCLPLPEAEGVPPVELLPVLYPVELLPAELPPAVLPPAAAPPLDAGGAVSYLAMLSITAINTINTFIYFLNIYIYLII